MLKTEKITEKRDLRSIHVLVEAAVELAACKVSGALEQEFAKTLFLQYATREQECLLVTRQDSEMSGFLCGELASIPGNDKVAVAPLVMTRNNLAMPKYQCAMADLSARFQQWAEVHNVSAVYVLLPSGVLPRNIAPVSRVYKRSFIAESGGSISDLSEPRVYRDGILVDKEGRKMPEKNRRDKDALLPEAHLLGPESVGEMMDFVRTAQLGSGLPFGASEFAAWLEGAVVRNSDWRIFVWRRNGNIAGLSGGMLRQDTLSSDMLCYVAAFMVWDEAVGGRECRNTRSALTRGVLRWASRNKVRNVYFVLPPAGDYWRSYCEEWKLLPHGVVCHAGDIAKQWRVRAGDKVRIPGRNTRNPR